jgi:methylsterol monooxygenase
MIAQLIVCPHSFTQAQWMIWLLWTNFDDHLGYAFPWSAVRWFPFCGLTEHHEFHHAINMGCFASKLNIYDKLFNSESKYLAWRSKRTQAGAKEE